MSVVYPLHTLELQLNDIISKFIRWNCETKCSIVSNKNAFCHLNVFIWRSFFRSNWVHLINCTFDDFIRLSHYVRNGTVHQLNRNRFFCHSSSNPESGDSRTEERVSNQFAWCAVPFFLLWQTTLQSIWIQLSRICLQVVKMTCCLFFITFNLSFETDKLDGINKKSGQANEKKKTTLELTG